MEPEPEFYDYIVVGLGGIGSAALYWLARNSDKRVLGLEQFELGHVNGGSQDHSRIIRYLYDYPQYVKLAKTTYEAWHEAERESGLQLVYKTGCMFVYQFNEAAPKLLENYRDSLNEMGARYEYLDGAALHKRFPQFVNRPDLSAILDPEGGIVDAALGNAVHIQLARARGAHIRDNVKVLELRPTHDGGCQVLTSAGTFRCRRVVISAGAWINKVLQPLGVTVPVNVTQENVTYFATPNIKKFTKDKYLGSTAAEVTVKFQSDTTIATSNLAASRLHEIWRFPSFIFCDGQSNVYSLPIHGNACFKIGFDAGGNRVDPDKRNFIPDRKREEAISDYCKKLTPEGFGPIQETKCCLYTMTLDRHFVVDTLAYKGLPQVVVCCGAGHAYKFAAALGKILSELAIDGQTPCDISSFNITRRAIQDPNFKCTFDIGFTHSRL